tara:strand:- start:1385 stop:2473 length:1089 start_codon:yes stop_codon:yes gene_type:complete
MTNRRTYWAVEALSTGVHGASAGLVENSDYLPGVQSVGLTTNFNLEQIFQLGQLEIYQDLEEVPDVEITVERAMDQFTCLYGRAMDPAAPNAVNISGDQNNQVDVFFSVGDDANENINDADLLAVAYCSGMFCSSASFNFGTDGFFTESISLVGNHKIWNQAPAAANIPTGGPKLLNIDTGNVAKRQKFAFLSAGVPTPLEDLSVDNNVSALTNTHAVSSVSVSVDFGREEMNTLGSRQPYHRYVTFPVEVTCDIEAYVTDAANMIADAHPENNNTTENAIKFGVFADAVNNVEDGGAGVRFHAWDLGAKNRLQSVTWNGLDTGGTNATITYSYRNFNKLDYTYKGGDAVVPADLYSSTVTA